MSQHIYTYDPANDQLNEIGGAGHIIKNESGTSFTKRENLQFDGMKVSDDATNNTTIVAAVETNFVGTWAQWQALTLAEKAQYKTVDLIDDFNGDPIDAVPTENSPHAVSSGGTYAEIQTLTNDKVNVSDIVNNLTTTTEGKVLDARQGKAINDKITYRVQNGSWSVASLSTSYSITFKRFGNIVISNIILISTEDIPVYTQIFTIPSGFRPIGSIPAGILVSGNNPPISIYVSSDGTGRTANITGILKANTYYSGILVYTTNDD